jgi:inner membrane protease subunit 1
MLPTIAEAGEAVIENRLSFRLNPGCLNRGDLVTFESPLAPGRLVCKRLLGLPGDIICVDPTGSKAPSSEHVVIPKGHIWLMGDNADLSRDSRDYGPVPLTLVRGTLWARVRSAQLPSIITHVRTGISLQPRDHLPEHHNLPPALGKSIANPILAKNSANNLPDRLAQT